ncbi:hypothetical protein KW801_01170 [Candidatus Saccharibacteria bacterium]|nr:hypothetical protein [Candidatus Saccharibacteria bacterium]
MDTNKQVLRQKFRQIRLAMSREEVEDKSKRICQRLLSEVDLEIIENLLVYKPIKKLNEIELGYFVTQLKAKQPLIKIDVIQPRPAQPPKAKYDLIIVPLLAFDKNNQRLGRGGGWYDKFLATQPQATKIGVGFQNGFVEQNLPHESHDMRLDKVITEI